MTREGLAEAICAAVAAAQQAGAIPALECPPIEVCVPPNPAMGDFSINIAMILAKQAGMKPRDLAAAVIEHLDLQSAGCEKAEIAGPGFINLYLGCSWLHQATACCLAQGETYGRGTFGAGKKVQLEFISANPVGPIHIGNARGGPYGDVLANLFEAMGYEAQREYYVNDGPYNTQALLFGMSLQARYRDLLGLDSNFPENGYQGDYVIEYAKELVEREGDKLASIEQGERGGYEFFRTIEPRIVEAMKQVVGGFGVCYDNWFHEADLYEQGLVQAELDRLLEMGAAYKKDNATWLKTGEHGDEEDRVLVRSDGRPTYIASDAAYARYKYEHFDLAIYILGPDHAGYVPRLKAAIAAGGIDLDQVEIIVHQTVRLLRGGEPVRLSKRRGSIIGLDEIVDEVGCDAARFFFLMRSVDSHLDFDLDLAKKQSDENPVYYVQYAHARICSIERMAEEKGFEFAAEPNLSLLMHPSELALMRVIADYPHELRGAMQARAPHRLTTMARDLASAFHQFYGNCKVLAPEDVEMSTARMALVKAARQLLSNQLCLMGLTTPEKM
ncbi:MAG: arginine--tRNA ligase [Armatimonadota bacterium]